jgi:hypothetical protein
MVFDPAHLTLAGLGSQEAASVLDYLKRLSVRNQSDSIRYSGNPVSQVRLLGHYIDHLRLGALAQTIATAQSGDQNNAYCGAKQETRAGAAKERQSSEHMRGRVSLSPLDRISYRDAPPSSPEAPFLDEKTAFAYAQNPFSILMSHELFGK